MMRNAFKRLTPHVLALVVSCGAVVLGACSANSRHLDADTRTPDLVLAGGGVQNENDEVLDAMVAHLKPGDTGVIIPFASGDQAGSAGSAKGRFESRREGVKFEVMPDPAADASAVEACVEMVDRCRMVFFTGGDQSRITARLLPPNVGAPILSALRRARSRGAVFCGTSAGTAVMSTTMFTGGGSESALANLPADDGEPDGATANAKPPARGVRLAPGIAMLGRDDVIMDSHVLRRGRYGRMVAALEKSGAKFAVGAADNCAVAITGDILRAIDENSVLIVDARQMKREGENIVNARVSILTRGDTFDLDAPLGDPRAFLSWEGHMMCVLRSDEAPDSPAEPRPRPSAWGRDGLPWLSERLRAEPGSVVTLESERFEVRLSADGLTRFPGGKHEATPRIVNARLDIVPRRTADVSVQGSRIDAAHSD